MVGFVVFDAKPAPWQLWVGWDLLWLSIITYKQLDNIEIRTTQVKVPKTISNLNQIKLNPNPTKISTKPTPNKSRWGESGLYPHLLSCHPHLTEQGVHANAKHIYMHWIDFPKFFFPSIFLPHVFEHGEASFSADKCCCPWLSFSNFWKD